MKARNRKNQALLLVGFLFVIFFSASAFGADGGQAECAAVRCPEGFTLDYCKSAGDYKCKRTAKPANPCAPGYQVQWTTFEGCPSSYKCVAQPPANLPTCPSGGNPNLAGSRPFGDGCSVGCGRVLK